MRNYFYDEHTVVKETTLQMLNRVKEKLKAKSLDETIIMMIKKIKIPDSRFGSQPNLTSFKERAKELLLGVLNELNRHICMDRIF